MRVRGIKGREDTRRRQPKKKKKSVADRDAEERTELTRCVTRMNSRGFFVFIAVVRKKTIKHKELSKQFPISLQHAQMQSHT